MNPLATDELKQGTLYIVTCGAPPAAHVTDLIRRVRSQWQHIGLIASRQAIKFIDAPLIEALTGYPVRSEYKQPGTPDMLPKADMIVAVPVTFNTMNKWALGIGDTLASSILCEYLGRKTPIIAVPWPNADLANHPAYVRNVQVLLDCGVHIIHEREKQSSSETISWDEIVMAIANIRTSIRHNLNRG